MDFFAPMQCLCFKWLCAFNGERVMRRQRVHDCDDDGDDDGDDDDCDNGPVVSGT